jgi:hypothetical protein
MGLDGAIGVECRSAVTPRVVLEADIPMDGVFGLAHAQILRNLILEFRDFLGFAFRKESKAWILKGWLGGLDSNQDNQIQSLMYCQLYDLPAAGKKKGPLARPCSTLAARMRIRQRVERASVGSTLLQEA